MKFLVALCIVLVLHQVQSLTYGEVINCKNNHCECPGGGSDWKCENERRDLDACMADLTNSACKPWAEAVIFHFGDEKILKEDWDLSIRESYLKCNEYCVAAHALNAASEIYGECIYNCGSTILQALALVFLAVLLI